MAKTFDALFKKFFKPKKNKTVKPNTETKNSIEDEVKKVLDMLNTGQPIDDFAEQQIDENLGKPDKTEFFEQDGFFYEKRIWHTPSGDLVKMIITTDPSLITPPKPEKSLEEKLKEAVENEEFEKAAAIRDRIKESKKKK